MRAVASALIAILALVVWSACAWAQSVVQEPEALKQMRATFEQRLRIASGSLNDFYARALANLETSLAASGDYEQARAVKTRREELAAIGMAAATATAAAASPVTIPLAIESARTSGAVSGRGGSLQGWRSTSCAAEWTISKFTPGAYRLQVSYSMSAKQPDTTAPAKTQVEASETVAFMLREVSLLPSAAKNFCAVPLKMTKGETVEETTDGTVNLTRPPIALRLACAEAYPSNVISIKSVKLVAAASTPTAPANAAVAAVNLADELKKLRDGMKSKLAAVRGPEVKAYVAKLEELASKRPASDEAWHELLESEKHRAQKATTDLSAKSGRGLEGYDEIEAAQFVPDPSNTGDSFLVTDGKETLRVRLAYVSCVPVDPKHDRVRYVADRFRIDVDDALALAQSAQQFTLEYLQGRTLRLLVKRQAKKNDALPALVLLDDVGMFQGVLIDHGLAVVDAPSAASDNEYVKLLKEREDIARKLPSPPGGWGMARSR